MGSKIKKVVFTIEKKFPLFGANLITLLRKLRYGWYRLRFFVNSMTSGSDGFDVFKVIYIDPSLVKYGATTRLFEDRGKVLDGNWDLMSTQKFTEGDTYQMLYQHFVENKPWTSTNQYKKLLETISGGVPKWGCSTQKEFDSYLSKIDDLYFDIKQNGYKRNSDPSAVAVYTDRQDKNLEKLDEVAVSIARDGSFLFNDGAHRLTIAQILGISEIPVVVVARHRKWVDFTREVKNFATTQPSGKLYQCAYHPDLLEIPCDYKDERWPAIKEHISSETQTALDIGANFGYMCFLLEKQCGVDATMVEINPHEVQIARVIRDALEASFTIEEKNILSYGQGSEIKFDTVLALNIFHHFLKRKTEYEKLVSFLHKLSCKEIFFEAHNHKETQMNSAYRNYPSEEFAKFVMKEAGLSEYKKIGEYENGRILYKIF